MKAMANLYRLIYDNKDSQTPIVFDFEALDDTTAGQKALDKFGSMPGSYNKRLYKIGTQINDQRITKNNQDTLQAQQDGKKL